MDKSEYRKALQAARAEFQKLLQKRLELDERIIRLKQTIAGLANLCDGSPQLERDLSHVVPLPPRFMRLTSAIRQVLSDSKSPVRPPELRTALQEHGLNMAHYANKLAVIHNTLARLERQGEAAELSDGWIITEKGRLASRMDALDFAPANGARPEAHTRTNKRT